MAAQYVNFISQLQAQKRNTMHILHFILTLVFWPWVVVWIALAWSNNKHNQVINTEIIKLEYSMSHNKGLCDETK